MGVVGRRYLESYCAFFVTRALHSQNSPLHPCTRSTPTRIPFCTPGLNHEWVLAEQARIIVKQQRPSDHVMRSPALSFFTCGCKPEALRVGDGKSIAHASVVSSPNRSQYMYVNVSMCVRLRPIRHTLPMRSGTPQGHGSTARRLQPLWRRAEVTEALRAQSPEAALKSLSSTTNSAAPAPEPEAAKPGGDLAGAWKEQRPLSASGDSRAVGEGIFAMPAPSGRLSVHRARFCACFSYSRPASSWARLDQDPILKG